jgi:4'-phosphopantetheinyl transferase
MIKILFARSSLLPPEKLRILFDRLPHTEQLRIDRYTNERKKRERIIGRMLLKNLIQAFELESSLGLEGLDYTDRFPRFHQGLHFSIAHTEGITICAGSITEKTGIDIERIKRMELSPYEEYFTKQEWKYIDQDICRFFELWTRKEALLKAAEIGVVSNLNQLEVLENMVVFAHQSYTISSTQVASEYICHLDTTATRPTI